MRNHLALPIVTTIALTFAAIPAEALKNGPYPEVKVEVAELYRPDPAFAALRRAFGDAVVKKDAAALFKLVGPTFVWTLNNGPVVEFDMGRDALHNFKVVFGFRQLGKDTDGGVEGGPFWGDLLAFATESTYNDTGNLVCSPVSASLVDQDIFDEARKAVETSDDDQADWYFTLANTPVMKARGDTGAPIARIGTIAVPVLSTYPSSEGENPARPTHLEVLLPSGKTGWIAASAARQLQSDQLCFAKTPSGEWKIVAFDQAG